MKHLVVEETEHQIEEECWADEICQRLDDQAPVALREREQVSKRLTMQRKLCQAKRDLEEAKLVASFLGGAGGDELGH